MDSLLALILWLLVAAIVLYCVNLLVSMLTLPAQAKIIILLLVSLVFVVLLLRQLGVWL